MSEHRDFYSMKKREDLSLTSRDNKNNRLNSKIRKRPFKSKSKRENSERRTININTNDIKNSPVLLAINKVSLNDLNKNNIKDALSISTFIEASLNKKIIINY